MPERVAHGILDLTRLIDDFGMQSHCLSDLGNVQLLFVSNRIQWVAVAYQFAAMPDDAMHVVVFHDPDHRG